MIPQLFSRWRIWWSDSPPVVAAAAAPAAGGGGASAPRSPAVVDAVSADDASGVTAAGAARIGGGAEVYRVAGRAGLGPLSCRYEGPKRSGPVAAPDAPVVAAYLVQVGQRAILDGQSCGRNWWNNRR
ncbi:MAG: hypothetical protein R3E79_47340 [Caldilineaceae bacterium]